MISDIFREILKAMYCLCYKLAYEMYYAQFTYHFLGKRLRKLYDYEQFRILWSSNSPGIAL